MTSKYFFLSTLIFFSINASASIELIKDSVSTTETTVGCQTSDNRTKIEALLVDSLVEKCTEQGGKTNQSLSICNRDVTSHVQDDFCNWTADVTIHCTVPCEK